MDKVNLNNSMVFLSIKQVCNYLQICRNTLRKLPIPKIQIRRRVLYQKAAVLNFIRENTTRSEK